jgi:hypothetical protein
MATLSLKLKSSYKNQEGTKMYCYRLQGPKTLINKYIADMEANGSLSQEDDGTPLFHTKFPVLAGTEFVKSEKSGKWYPDNTFLNLFSDLCAQNPSLPVSFLQEQAREMVADMRKADSVVEPSVSQDPPFDLEGE